MLVHVVVVEENLLAGQGLAQALTDEPAIAASAASGSHQEIVDQCRSLRQCVLVVNDRFAEGLDFQTLHGNAGRDCAARVIVLGSDAGRDVVLFWLRLGCAGYLSRQEGLDTLKKAVLAAASGQIWARRVDMAALLAELLDAKDKRPLLTPRERDIHDLIAGGLTNAQISSSLCISMETVRWHVRRLLIKLGARNRAQVIELAQRLGMQGRPAAVPLAVSSPSPQPVQKASWAHRRPVLGIAHRS